MTLMRRFSRRVGCASDPRLDDGTIMRVDRMGDVVHVLVEPRARCTALLECRMDALITVVFHDVATVNEAHPEGMLYSTILEWDTPGPLRRFEFANWFQPGDDWDPYLAQCNLEIIARGYTVIDQWMRD